jgi:arsenite methyltransferase
VVVDLGCGAGIDVIFAARRIAPGGKVVGVDFAQPMIERATQAVAEAGLTDLVEFVVGDFAESYLPDDFADAVISNCVINLCPDKDSVYRETFRILKPRRAASLVQPFGNKMTYFESRIGDII